MTEYYKHEQINVDNFQNAILSKSKKTNAEVHTGLGLGGRHALGYRREWGEYREGV